MQIKKKSEEAKKLILSAIKSANNKNISLQEKNIDIKEIYKKIEEPLEECFSKELKTVNGEVFLCKSEEDMFCQLQTRLTKNYTSFNLHCQEENLLSSLEKHQINTKKGSSEMDISLTTCEALIARTGSVLVSSLHSQRELHAFPDLHIIIAKKSQIFSYLHEGISFLKEKYQQTNFPSMITCITGPSRTADIEKTLILGAHGPKESWVFIDTSK